MERGKKLTLRTEIGLSSFASLILITVQSLISGVFAVEMLRRITDGLWNNNYQGLIVSLIGFFAVIVINFIVIFLNKCITFHLIKMIDFHLEDRMIQNYVNAVSWPRDYSEDVLSYLRKIVPETVTSVLNLTMSSYQLVVLLIGGSLYGFQLNSFLLILCIIVTALMVVLSSRVLGRVPKLYQTFVDKNAHMYNLVWEQIKNREIASFLRKEKVMQQYTAEGEEYVKVVKKIKKSTNGPDLFAMFGSTFLIILSVLFGGRFVLTGEMQPADLLAFIMLIPTISSNFFRIPALITSWKESKGKIHKVKKMLEKPQYNAKNCSKLEGKAERIKIENIAYQYESKTALNHLSLQFDSGIFYALTGESGSGKTTLMKILAKILPQYIGTIQINGLDFKTLDRRAYWDRIAYVTQDPIILADTIANNITMGEETVDEQRLKEAISDTYMEDWIGSQKEGLNTIIGIESLSKGEIQRINLARALYRRCDILLIDEGTEALDPRTEMGVIESLKRRIKREKQILIFITHRIQLIRLADQIIFLSSGSVEGAGSYQSLLSQNESFKTLIEGMSR